MNVKNNGCSTVDFFKAVFNPLLDKDNNFNNDEFIQITKIDNNNIATDKAFKNIDEAVNYARQGSKNTYFCLTTTDGINRQTEHLKTRTCLGFDFDKKQLGDSFNHIDILNIFRKIGLFYNIVVDSGNGYHVYICIEPTKDLDLVDRLQKDIANKISADLNATLKTQILRVPFTFNVKDENNWKTVKIVYLDNNIKRKNINKLSQMYFSINSKSDEKRNLKYIKNKIPPCVVSILDTGTAEGDRQKDLYNIVCNLRDRNFTEAHIKSLIKDWNTRNRPPIKETELNYQVKYLFNNRVNKANLGCNECENKSNCFYYVPSEFKYDKDDILIKLSEKSISKIKNRKSKRKGVTRMTGNMLIIYSILKNHQQGLFRDELEKELSYKSKRKKIDMGCLFSKNTLSDTLKKLEENKFINVSNVGKKKFYRVASEKVKDENTFIISYSACYEAVKRNITVEEYELYCYMRYLHNKALREGTARGNTFRINQEDLAKDLGLTQQRISQMLENLEDEHIISIFKRKNENTLFSYNIYALNY